MESGEVVERVGMYMSVSWNKAASKVLLAVVGVKLIEAWPAGR